MYHSITIGTKNTWDDWHLIPRTRPLVNPPEVKVSQVEIPGGDGSIDLTSVLAGRPTYKNRTGSWEFIVENGFKDWSVLFSEIMAYLHGRKLTAILEDDPNYFYEGRFSVNSWKSDQHYSTIVIDYDVGPYKKENDIGEAWIWDTFNFETGVIQTSKNVPCNGSVAITINGGSDPVTPIIIVSASGFTVTFNGVEYELTKGNNYIQDIVITHGENTFVFSGNGTVTVDYRGGIL